MTLQRRLSKETPMIKNQRYDHSSFYSKQGLTAPLYYLKKMNSPPIMPIIFGSRPLFALQTQPCIITIEVFWAGNKSMGEFESHIRLSVTRVRTFR